MALCSRVFEARGFLRPSRRSLSRSIFSQRSGVSRKRRYEQRNPDRRWRCGTRRCCRHRGLAQGRFGRSRGPGRGCALCGPACPRL